MSQAPAASDAQKLQLLRKEFLKLRSEHEELQQKLVETNKMKAKLKLVGMLQDDRKLLSEELAQANAKIAELLQENLQLKDTIQELQAENKVMQTQALKLNQFLNLTLDDIKTSAVQNTRTTQANKEERMFQQKFSLPETETLITTYTCLDSKLRGGKIYLSPNYVCFGAHFPRIQGEADVVMPIKDIMMLKKVKTIGVGGGHGLEFIARSGMAHAFRGFINRKSCIENVQQQAQKFGGIPVE